LTALGFKVRAVFGFSPNDEMFAQKSGGADLSYQLYGVVVLAGKEAVSDRLRETRSSATVTEVMPLVMSAVGCEI
jgi:hypothetical protein